jgi:hypothetical protein
MGDQRAQLDTGSTAGLWPHLLPLSQQHLCPQGHPEIRWKLGHITRLGGSLGWAPSDKLSMQAVALARMGGGAETGKGVTLPHLSNPKQEQTCAMTRCS